MLLYFYKDPSETSVADVKTNIKKLNRIIRNLLLNRSGLEGDKRSARIKRTIFKLVINYWILYKKNEHDIATNGKSKAYYTVRNWYNLLMMHMLMALINIKYDSIQHLSKNQALILIALYTAKGNFDAASIYIEELREKKVLKNEQMAWLLMNQIVNEQYDNKEPLRNKLKDLCRNGRIRLITKLQAYIILKESYEADKKHQGCVDYIKNEIHILISKYRYLKDSYAYRACIKES